jgi:hypothetical protein
MGCDSLTVEHRPAQSRMATPPVVRIFGVTTAKSRMRWLKSRRLPKNPEEIANLFLFGEFLAGNVRFAFAWISTLRFAGVTSQRLNDLSAAGARAYSTSTIAGEMI